MKKFFTIFFVVLGVIFFILIIAISYTYMANSTNLPAQNLEPEKVENTKTGSSETSSTTTTEDKNSILSPTQEKALETIGVDPSEIPSSFTPEQLTCFEEILGKTRIEEIKTGDTPTATEFFKAKSCI